MPNNDKNRVICNWTTKINFYKSRKLWLCNKGLYYAAYCSSEFEPWCSRQRWCTVRHDARCKVCVQCVQMSPVCKSVVSLWHAALASPGQIFRTSTFSYIVPTGSGPTVYEAVASCTVSGSRQGQAHPTALGDITIIIASELIYAN